MLFYFLSQLLDTICFLLSSCPVHCVLDMLLVFLNVEKRKSFRGWSKNVGNVGKADVSKRRLFVEHVELRAPVYRCRHLHRDLLTYFVNMFCVVCLRGSFWLWHFSCFYSVFLLCVNRGHCCGAFTSGLKNPGIFKSPMQWILSGFIGFGVFGLNPAFL